MNVERRETIKEILNTKGEVLLKDLEAEFPGCSSMTLRRDLIYLEENGFVRRTRGGAVALSRLSMSAEDVYSRRALEHTKAKQLIARKASKYIENGRSLFLDSGTTMMLFAKEVPDDYVSILTSGPNIAIELIKKSKPNVTLVGGQLSRNTISVSGAGAADFLKRINIDIAFLATSGYSAQNGFTSGTFTECELKQAVLQSAARSIMLMDSSKVGKSMTYTFATMPDIDVLISDDKLPADVAEAAKQSGVLVE